MEDVERLLDSTYHEQRMLALILMVGKYKAADITGSLAVGAPTQLPAELSQGNYPHPITIFFLKKRRRARLRF